MRCVLVELIIANIINRGQDFRHRNAYEKKPLSNSL